MTCSAVGWGAVSDATANATCMNTTNTITNETLPGDYCKAASECFGLADKVSCTDGVCVTSYAVGDKCAATDNMAADAWCPVGTYCNSTGVCGTRLTEGGNCTTMFDCDTGFACVTNKTEGATTTQAVCTKFFSYTPGTKFDASKMFDRGIAMGIDAMCSTFHKVKTDTDNVYECRAAPYTGSSADATLDDLVRASGITSDCNYTSFDTDAENGTASSDSSLCGFNKDGSAYCNKRKGDPWFTAILATIAAIDISGVQCNPVSSLAACKAFVDTIKPANLKTFVRENLSLSAYANYANNAGCVAESITLSYWQGDSPDYAFGSLTLSSLATIVLTISALFYMF